MENLIWALIIVTGAANVNVSTGYPNKALCEDAISIAKTGRTWIEQKSYLEAEKIREDRLEQEFQDAHPSRPATEDDIKKCTMFSGSLSGFRTRLGWDPICFVDVETNITSFIRPNTAPKIDDDPASKIKFARCVMVTP